MPDIAEILERAAARPAASIDPRTVARRGRRRVRLRRTGALIALAAACSGAIALRPRGDETVATSDPSAAHEEGSTVAPPVTAPSSVAVTGHDVDLMVWVEAGASAAEVAAIGDALATSRLVTMFWYHDQSAEYDEFLRHFADQPELLETVRSGDLPSRFLVDLVPLSRDPAAAPGAALEESEEWLTQVVTLSIDIAALPGVRAVEEPAGPDEEPSPMTSVPPGFVASPD